MPVRDSHDSLRALAHPLRSRILAQLRLHGEATATTLAAALGTHTGATSYHLRALAAAGLVEEVDHGEGRRRWWRATVSTTAGPGFEEPVDEDEAAMLRWLQQDYVQHFADQASAYAGSSPQEPWASACGLRDAAVLVSAEQLHALRAELDEVLARYRRAGAGTPGARRVAAYTCLLPVGAG